MTDRRNQTTDENDLIAWERLPAIALGISQGLNIFLWYVMSLERVALHDGRAPARVPEFVVSLLPIAVFVAAIAAAVSLDGTMIATVLGSRNGRDGVWTWVTVVAAALFSAGIALDVYGGNVLPGAWLHIAQTAVLLCYMMHLRQPRKDLQSNNQGLTTVTNRVNANGQIEDLGHIKGFKCACGEIFPTLNAVKAHKQINCSQTFKVASLPDLTQHKDAASQNGRHDV